MVHRFSVLVELTYDDENGEYATPSTRKIEIQIENAIAKTIQRLGFDDDFYLEVAKGSLEEAYGLNE